MTSSEQDYSSIYDININMNMKISKPLTVVSCFAGMGGSSQGYKEAGCKVLAMVEWEDHACQVYRLNHPDTEIIQADIEKLSGSEILRRTGLKKGELDILDGSPPCQGFSMVGRRQLDDPRNSLFRSFLRIADEIDPKNIVIENVAGMIRGKMKPVAAEIIRALKDRGYQVTAGLIKAMYFGVPQQRPRVFFLASKNRKPVLPQPTHRFPVSAGKALEGVRDISGISVPDITGEWRREFVNNAFPGEDGRQYNRRKITRRSPNYGFGWIVSSSKDPVWTLIKVQCIFHWEKRHFNITEALILTGFPADYKMTGTYGQCWQRIGNSVAPPMTRAIARSLMKTYEQISTD